VSPAFVLSLAVLGIDAGAPPWLPRPHPIDLSDQVTYNLRRAGDGYVYDDPRFEARVARDGVVTFKDKHAHAHVAFPTFLFLEKGAGPKGPTLESTLRDYLSKGRRGKAEPEALPPSPPLHKLEQTEICPPSSSCYFLPSPPKSVEVRGSFDLTDEIMRAHGQDPYAREKARFLSSTFELRMKMAVEARKADLTSSFASLPERLEELWSDERYLPRERRRIFYEMWCETDQTAEGERAARAIEAFIRRRLPCGSPAGYTADELESLQKLHPERRFRAAEDCEQATPR
jgi:hypothetical protein